MAIFAVAVSPFIAFTAAFIAFIGIAFFFVVAVFRVAAFAAFIAIFIAFIGIADAFFVVAGFLVATIAALRSSPLASIALIFLRNFAPSISKCFGFFITFIAIGGAAAFVAFIAFIAMAKPRNGQIHESVPPGLPPNAHSYR